MTIKNHFARLPALACLLLVLNGPRPLLADESSKTAKSTLPAPGVVLAKGKGFEVTRDKLDAAIAVYNAQMSRGGKLPPDSREVVEAKLLDHIIDTEILVRKATDEERKHAQEITERIMTDSRKKFATDEDFRKWLQTMGMTPEQYRARTEAQGMCEFVIDREVAPTVVVSDDEVKKYYEANAVAFDKPAQVRVRQIFLSTVDPATHDPLPDDQKKKKEKRIEEAKAQLDQGRDFFKVYKEFSEEPWTKAETEGDEPLYVRGQMPPEFDAVAFALKPKEISGIVKSPLGFHIIRVSEQQPASRLPLAEVAPRLREFLVTEEVKKRLPDYLKRVRKDADVEIIRSDSAPAIKAATKSN